MLASDLMMVNLSLQLLDVACVYRLVLNDPVAVFDHDLQVLHFLFVLFVLYHCFLLKDKHILKFSF